MRRFRWLSWESFNEKKKVTLLLDSELKPKCEGQVQILCFLCRRKYGKGRCVINYWEIGSHEFSKIPFVYQYSEQYLNLTFRREISGFPEVLLHFICFRLFKCGQLYSRKLKVVIYLCHITPWVWPVSLEKQFHCVLIGLQESLSYIFSSMLLFGITLIFW